MRFDIDKCPQCGGPPIGIHETMPATYYLYDVGDGEFDYDGMRASKVFDEGSEPVCDSKGRVTLQCEQEHEWQTLQEE